MRLSPVCQRSYRRGLMLAAGSLGFVLQETVNCSEQASEVLLLGLENLTIELVSLIFDTWAGGTGETAETARAITETIGSMLT